MAIKKRARTRKGKFIGYSYTVILRDDNGVQKCCGTFHRKADADDEETRLKNLRNTGGVVTSTKDTFGDFLDRWLQDYAQLELKHSTVELYSTIANKHIKPVLGRVRLDKLRPTHIQKYLADKRKSGRLPRKKEQPAEAKSVKKQKDRGVEADTRVDPGLSGKYLIQHHAIIHRALQCAVEWNVLQVNVCDRVNRPKAESEEQQVLNEEQAVSVLQAAEGTDLYPVILLALATGMRRGEILGLRWHDVRLRWDTEQKRWLGLVQVRQTMESVQQEPGKRTVKPGTPKTEKSRRTISLPAGSPELLKQWKAIQKERRLQAGPLFHDRDLMCSHYDGSPLDPKQVSKNVSTLIRSLGFECTLHGLRHSHVSLLIAQNVHLKVISNRLGHAQIGTTGNIYSHLLPGLDEQAADSIGDIFATNKAEKQEKKTSG
ncbi:MAG: tyrosine-type recombinase/integrase [Candidatus Desulforudaceae bacterium]